MQKLEIIAQPFVTPKGVVREGEELVVNCPMWLCKTNVKKVCGKCMAKQRISYKEKFVECKYERK